MLEYEYAKVLTELIVSERDPLLEEKWAALRKIMGRADAYKKEGFLEEIICKFVQKKAEMILRATKKSELNEIIQMPKPYYDGNKIVSPSKYDTKEEELILWSSTSLKGPLVSAGYERYKELFCKLLPEQGKQVFPGHFKNGAETGSDAA